MFDFFGYLNRWITGTWGVTPKQYSLTLNVNYSTKQHNDVICYRFRSLCDREATKVKENVLLKDLTYSSVKYFQTPLSPLNNIKYSEKSFISKLLLRRKLTGKQWIIDRD